MLGRCMGGTLGEGSPVHKPAVGFIVEKTQKRDIEPILNYKSTHWIPKEKSIVLT